MAWVPLQPIQWEGATRSGSSSCSCSTVWLILGSYSGTRGFVDNSDNTLPEVFATRM